MSRLNSILDVTELSESVDLECKLTVEKTVEE